MHSASPVFDVPWCSLTGRVGIMGYSRTGRLWQATTLVLPWHRCHTHVFLYWLTRFIGKYSREVDSWSKAFLPKCSNYSCWEQEGKLCVSMIMYVFQHWLLVILKLHNWIKIPTIPIDVIIGFHKRKNLCPCKIWLCIYCSYSYSLQLGGIFPHHSYFDILYSW